MDSVNPLAKFSCREAAEIFWENRPPDAGLAVITILLYPAILIHVRKSGRSYCFARLTRDFDEKVILLKSFYIFQS
jgi:hypothetical protein